MKIIKTDNNELPINIDFGNGTELSFTISAIKELNKKLNEIVHSIELEIIGEYIREGEIIRKTVAHDETVLYIGESDDQIVIMYPTDLDNFVQVGNYIKLTLEVE